MSRRLKTLLFVLVLAAPSGISSAQDVRILLRAKDGKTRFHLGEALTLEAACVDSTEQHYLSPCSVVLKAEAVSNGARLSADHIDQLTWDDAQSGSLPPGLRGGCGTTDNQPPSQRSNVPKWQDVTLEEPFPVYVGEYEITAKLAFDLEMADRFGRSEEHSSSDEVEISLDDNLDWKNHQIHFHGCAYDDRLILIPDQDAITALRMHLDDCAVTWPEPYAALLHEIVWLKMQVEQPGLYARMLELEHTRLPVIQDNGEGKPDLEGLQQARLNAKGDVNLIQTWFHEQYRDLLLETAQQLVAAYNSHPELRGNEDFQGNLEDGFENWHDAAATLPGGARAYVSADEVKGFLKQVGRTQAYIAKFMKEQKTSLPGELPYYPQRTNSPDKVTSSGP
jgi:hypothetical protein